jgi:hypothetical protein
MARLPFLRPAAIFGAFAGLGEFFVGFLSAFESSASKPALFMAV